MRLTLIVEDDNGHAQSLRTNAGVRNLEVNWREDEYAPYTGLPFMIDRIASLKFDVVPEGQGGLFELRQTGQNAMLTFLERVEMAQQMHPEWRVGQTVSNVFKESHPKEARLLVGHPSDCFNKDSNVAKYLMLIKEFV